MEDLVIMYHYVMEPEEWKGSVPISPSDFRKQVEWAKEHYEIIKPEDIHKQTQKPKCIISFDDATKDQYTNAFRILKELNVPGYFTIMSGPLIERKVPIFHLVHTVLSHFKEEQIWEEVFQQVNVTEIKNKSDIYSYEMNEYRRYVKYLFNFYWSEEQSRPYLERKVTSIYHTLENFIEEFYLSEREILEMDASGMSIGVHSVNHLPYEGNPQGFYDKEIRGCKNYLEKLLNKDVKLYTPSFGGGEQSIQMQVELLPILIENGFILGFTTEKGFTDMRNGFWHKRIDCNQLILNGVV
ncbi:polysaccharide deacetylase family protein [Lysinibacillus capsici]|uniref:polysaccharide deacetylase family protein n=1 Tax=Lysinibacillus capsici TaxID=2115968 RepID=UPI0021538ECF|nr:polysaccharide deacetylase family protein [Lysinibacillus capsici]MCR6523203.1 polysaccharide deacetylase family protein [Lysinibacillus capsici]